MILGSPAQTAGVEQGDQLLGIDEMQVDGQSPFQAASAISGGDAEPDTVSEPTVRLQVPTDAGSVCMHLVPAAASCHLWLSICLSVWSSVRSGQHSAICHLSLCHLSLCHLSLCTVVSRLQPLCHPTSAPCVSSFHGCTMDDITWSCRFVRVVPLAACYLIVNRHIGT